MLRGNIATQPYFYKSLVERIRRVSRVFQLRRERINRAIPIRGLGGCPFAGHAAAAGNVCTEDLVFMCDEMGIETGIALSTGQVSDITGPNTETGKGTGLGLAIVRHNTEIYGGKATVESALGKGTTFTLTFPAKATMTAAA